MQIEGTSTSFQIVVITLTTSTSLTYLAFEVDFTELTNDQIATIQDSLHILPYTIDT